MKGHILKLAVSIAICQGAGMIGGLFTSKAVTTWYQAIKKPAFTPPNWLFGPVWILLYLVMGIALFLVWKSADSGINTTPAITIFAIHLAFNVAWSYLFFYLNNPLAGLIEIILLWILILVTLLMFYQIHKVAGLLLIPYLLWVSFAAVLNYSIWALNK